MLILCTPGQLHMFLMSYIIWQINLYKLYIHEKEKSLAALQFKFKPFCFGAKRVEIGKTRIQHTRCEYISLLFILFDLRFTFFNSVHFTNKWMIKPSIFWVSIHLLESFNFMLLEFSYCDALHFWDPRAMINGQ